MTFEGTGLEGVYVIHLNPFNDERGSFVRMFCKNEFSEIGFDKEFVQVNHATNKRRGTFRGFHYQVPPFSETKLIRCIGGKILDFVIDIRKNSDTFLQHFSIELSPESNKMLLVPVGFAHGYITLEDDAELIYFHTSFYQKGFEAGLRYNDPVLNIELPFDPVTISERDLEHPLINSNFQGVSI